MRQNFKLGLNETAIVTSKNESKWEWPLYPALIHFLRTENEYLRCSSFVLLFQPISFGGKISMNKKELKKLKIGNSSK